MKNSYETPITSNESVKVMLRAERGDTIRISGFGNWTVVQRTRPYYGPKLTISAEDIDHDFNALLTAPGPASELQLWWPQREKNGLRFGWARGREVTVELLDVKQYDICPACGQPIKTLEHERRSAFGIGECA